MHLSLGILLDAYWFFSFFFFLELDDIEWINVVVRKSDINLIQFQILMYKDIFVMLFMS